MHLAYRKIFLLLLLTLVSCGSNYPTPFSVLNKLDYNPDFYLSSGLRNQFCEKDAGRCESIIPNMTIEEGIQKLGLKQDKGFSAEMSQGQGWMYESKNIFIRLLNVDGPKGFGKLLLVDARVK